MAYPLSVKRDQRRKFAFGLSHLTTRTVVPNLLGITDISENLVKVQTLFLK